MINANITASVSNLVMSQAVTLEERLASILAANGGRNTLSKEIRVDDVHAFNGMSGHNYWVGDELVGQLYMGTLVSGTYVIYKRTYIEDVITEKYDYYDPKGNLFYKSENLDGQCITYTPLTMDPTSPFINHIYNILHNEYEGATFNYGNTNRIQFLEDFLNQLYKSPNFILSVDDKLKDAAIKNISKEILEVEQDKVLKWSERQVVFEKLKDARSKILATKRRVHGFQYMLYDFAVRVSDIKLKYQTFKQRPLNNFIGSLYRHTFGHLFWFVNTVKSNMGYSVAMAIYGPFTFYFITQPMNPHAMWAVGKVRNAYIKVTDVLEPSDSTSRSMIADLDDDEVTTSQSSVAKRAARSEDIPWLDRMSNFKAMQIAYEESMLFAERMGRIEQFETQFNFPLTAEAAWMEMELYLNSIDNTFTNIKSLDSRFTTFLNNEKERTIELQFYIWQKMGQFFMDHPFIVVDEESEQTQRNYYLGRQFIFFKKMTEKLSKLGIANSPITHKNIEMLAKKFTKGKINGNSVLDTLKKNSRIFQQKDLFSSVEHRKYMKRHWEVLFMQQNKKQEASSFSLQAYTWSIKNAIWLLQTIYSAKRSELASITYKFNLNNAGKKDVAANPVMNEYLGNMFNNMVMEFVSIKKEMIQNLPGDKEATLRKNVINNIKAYLVERDKLFNTGVYAKAEDETSQKI